ncbi:MAG: 3-phosphoserine/phosphohydroxythreonine transaminase [Planctomycetota bacterium]
MTTSTATVRVFNFSAGPGVLPESVLEQVREDVHNIRGTGIGIMEHSHRGKLFDAVLEEAEARCRQIANISDDYAILFMTGGATSQNHLVPMNLLPEGGHADYAVTGKWAEASQKEAEFYGTSNVAYTSKPDNHNHVPTQDQLKLSPDAAYFHYTSNNTIAGTQYHYRPETPGDVPLVCDASSDFFSSPDLDVSTFGLIYAGAQKNIGPAGTTLVIVRKDLLERQPRPLPTLCNYKVFAEKGSRPNTPPVFPIYVVSLVFQWILDQGGLAPIAERNAAKAKVIYDVLDELDFYNPHAQLGSRSLMNITFRTPSEELDKAFVAESDANGMANLKGHRSVGGMRASIYNAFPPEGCDALAQFLRDFAAKHG